MSKRRTNDGSAISCDDVLEFVVSRGQDGTTYDEIIEYFDDESARARCVDLKNLGLVIDLPNESRITRKGRQAQVMVAVKNASKTAIESAKSAKPKIDIHARVEKLPAQETRFLDNMLDYCQRAADPGMLSALGPMKALGLDMSSLSFGSTFQALLAVIEWASQQNLELEQHTHAAYDHRDMLWAMLADLEQVARTETDSVRLRNLVKLIAGRRHLVCNPPDDVIEEAARKASLLSSEKTR